MPYPPKRGQSRSSYMSGCVRLLKSEGRNPGKARDVCFAVWKKGPKKKKKKRKRKRRR